MDIDALRSEMPFLNRCLYFNTGGIAPSTSVVTDTLINYFTDVRRQGPPLIMDSVANSERMADARQRIAARASTPGLQPPAFPSSRRACGRRRCPPRLGPL